MLRCFWLESKFWLWIHKPQYNGTMWNSLPDKLRHLDLSLGQFCRALKTHLFWLRMRCLVIFISTLTINLLIYLLTIQKKQLKQYIILCKTVADALKITVLNRKTSSVSGEAPLTPTPPGGRLGSVPRPPLYRLALPRSPWVWVWNPPFLYPPRPLAE